MNKILLILETNKYIAKLYKDLYEFVSPDTKFNDVSSRTIIKICRDIISGMDDGLDEYQEAGLENRKIYFVAFMVKLLNERVISREALTRFSTEENITVFNLGIEELIDNIVDTLEENANLTKSNTLDHLFCTEEPVEVTLDPKRIVVVYRAS